MATDSERSTTALPYLNRLRRRLATGLRRRNVSESAVIMATAVVVGVSTGLAALLFRYLIDAIGAFSYDFLAPRLGAIAPLHLLVLPALGGGLVGLLTTYAARETRGPGIPEVMEAVALHGGYIRSRVAVVKALAASLCIGTGGSAGREGPIAHIGSSLGSTVGRFLHLPEEQVKNLVACGAAGGIAATFNTPIAGSLFALELILGYFHATYFGAVVISAVVADVVQSLFLGNQRAFLVPEYVLVSPWELLFYALLGLLAAPLAVGFVQLLNGLAGMWEKTAVPDALKPMLGGALLGILGILTFQVDGFPRIFGVGYDTLTDALFSRLALPTLLALMLLKMLATAVTLSSGGSGGVFVPSLFIGAMLGGGFGHVMHALFPTITAASGAYALVGMAAFVSGAVHTPVTIIIMLFELTGNYTLILPLMIATVMSTIASNLIGHESIYTSKLSRRGVYLHRGKDIDVMHDITVGEVMSAAKVTVQPDLPVAELARIFDRTHSHGFPVVDAAGALVGAVSLRDYEKAVLEHTVETLCVADIAAMENLIVTYPQEPMSRALRQFAMHDISRLPVVAGPRDNRLVGVLRRADIIRAYQQALTKRAHYQHHVQRLGVEKADEATFGEIELFSQAWGAGRRLDEIRLPEGCLFVSVRRGAKLYVAQPHTVIQAGDRVTVFGEPDQVAFVRQQLTSWLGVDPGAPVAPRHHEVMVTAGSVWCGMRVQNLRLPRECLLVSVRRGDKVIVVHGDTRLEPGDFVELFGFQAELEQVEALYAH
jgi:chloride channel protein, CIC family